MPEVTAVRVVPSHTVGPAGSIVTLAFWALAPNTNVVVKISNRFLRFIKIIGVF
jgi:hypothetical protein